MIRVVKIGLPVHAALELAEGAAKVRHGVVQVAGVGKSACRDGLFAHHVPFVEQR